MPRFQPLHALETEETRRGTGLAEGPGINMKTTRYTPSPRPSASLPRPALLAALIALLGSVPACDVLDFDFSGDECSGDSDCWPGQGCQVGFLGRYCAERCGDSSDCSEGEFCSDGSFKTFPQCVPGCREDAECGQGHVCVGGTCDPGCREDAECDSGLFCTGGSGIAGTCQPGCRSDAECVSGSICSCNQCVVPGCSSDSDCAEGSYCADPDGSVCTPSRCEALPTPVTCGGAICEATVFGVAFGEAVLSPCCLEAGSGCGIDVGGLGLPGATCQVIGAPGASDPGCPAVESRYGALPGCRLPDGTCGVDPDSILGSTGEFGCLSAR